MSVHPANFKAADWFAQVQSGEMDAAAERSWVQWIENDGHQKAYENCELAWALSAELRNSPALTALLAQATRPKRRVPVWQMGLAASVIALGVFAWLLSSRPVVTEHSTAVGEQRTVMLTDGSTVLLNTDSSVRAEMSRHLRRITLVRGEALFSVSHDPDRPFEVHALQGVTTAVGTQFDVELTRGGAAVSVLEGTVTVGPGATGQTAARVAVSAGNGIGYTPAGAVSDTRPAEVGRIEGWRTQRMVFDDLPLDTALAEYNRYTRTPIVLSSPKLASRHVNGVFHIGDEAAFLSALEQGLHLQAVHGATETVLQPEPGYEP